MHQKKYIIKITMIWVLMSIYISSWITGSLTVITAMVVLVYSYGREKNCMVLILSAWDGTCMKLSYKTYTVISWRPKVVTPWHSVCTLWPNQTDKINFMALQTWARRCQVFVCENSRGSLHAFWHNNVIMLRC